MRSPVVAGAVLALAASTAAVASVAHLEVRRDRGHAHVPAALRARAQGGPVGWVARVQPPPASSTTPTSTTPGGEPPPTTTTATPPPPPEPTPLPRRTGVQLDETPAFSLTITRNPVAAGSVELTATNVGEDEHDLSVRDGSTVLAATGTIPPQEAAAITVDLPAGDYTLFCSLPGHEQGGMKGTLRVQ
jgi:hypothetical protein